MHEKLRRLLIVGGMAVVVAVAALGGLYILGSRAPNMPEGAGIFARLANGVTAITTGFTPPPTEQEWSFAFRRLEIDTTKPQAEACLVFTRDLDASGRTHYEDYFSIDPQTRVAAHVVGARLCMSGLAFNAT